MTTTTAYEVSARGPGRPRMPRSLSASLRRACEAAIDTQEAVKKDSYRWPSQRYQRDPVAFAREVLGLSPWAKQIEILEACRDHRRVAVVSGHKIGKSNAAAMVALWFFCSFPGARVVMSSVTSRQVDQILWRELRMMHKRSQIPVGGEIHELARSGLKADDFREIVGFTAREAEAVAGISGANLLYILDEASGIGEDIFEAIEGNRAGGARVVMFSNPTRTEGAFFEAFHAKRAFYHTIQVSSEDSPNVVAGRVLIPGLATKDWVEEKRAEWGPDSALFKVRVRGEFALSEDGKIIPLDLLQQSEQRWAAASEDGTLQIGIDPAGPGDAGDESVFAVRRGVKLLKLYAFRGLTEDAHLVHLVHILQVHRTDRETPVVVIDREGPIGTAVWTRVRLHAETCRGPLAFHVIGVRSSDKAARQPMLYGRMRDELWSNLAMWLRAGGSVFEDSRLAAELHSTEWRQDVTGRLKATPKDDLRKALGRSPDRADALALAVWEPLGSLTDVVQQARQADYFDQAGGALDPYAQRLDPYAAIDPYRR